MGDLAEARTTGEQSLSLLAEDEDDYSRVIYLVNLAEIYEACNDRGHMLALLERRRGLSEKLNHPRLPTIEQRLAEIAGAG